MFGRLAANVDASDPRPSGTRARGPEERPSPQGGFRHSSSTPQRGTASQEVLQARETYIYSGAHDLLDREVVFLTVSFSSNQEAKIRNPIC